MKNVNFDSLTNIKAPESWIENALNIPATVEAEKKKPIPFFRNTRVIAAVACLILVSVISVTIYLTQDRTTPTVDPSYSQNEPDVSTDGTADITSDNTESQSGEATKNNQDTQSSSQRPSKPYEEIEPTEGSSEGNPPEGSTNPDIVGPTQKPTIEPTEDPTEAPRPSAPTEVPTSKPTQKPTTPPSPTSKPTEKPPSVVPTEPIEPTEPWEPTEPIEPSEPPTDEPTESPTENPFRNIRFSCTIPSSYVADDSLVYCMVYNSNGYMIGDSNQYSSQHRAYVLGYNNGSAILSYSLPDGLITKHGNYTYYFYNRYGDILYQNTKYI